MLCPSTRQPKCLKSISLPHQLLFEVADDLADAGIDFHAVFHEAAGMKHGAVIATAKGFADGTEGAFSHLPRQEHGDLARERDILRPALAGHVREADIEVFGHFFLDDFDADGITAFFMKDFAKQAFDDFEAQLFAGQRRVGRNADEGAFEAADVRPDAVGEEIHDFLRQGHAHDLRLLIQNREAHFNIRRLQIGHQAPFKTRDEAMLEVLNFTRRAIAGEHDLLMAFVKGIEGVEKFFLDAFLARKELDIVDEQDVRLAIFFAELYQVVVLDGVDVLVREFFRRHIRDARAFLAVENVLADGVQQMGFAQTNPAVKEKRVVRFAGRLRDGEGGGVGKIIVVADDERVEGVLGIEIQFRMIRISISRSFNNLGFGGRGDCRLGERAVACAYFKFYLELAAGGERSDVLKQAHIIILEPHFTKIIGDFEDEDIPIEISRAQRFEPKFECVRTQHRAKMLLREIPNFLCGSLHCFFLKSPFFGHFIHLAS
jgi:hypothetical protein